MGNGTIEFISPDGKVRNVYPESAVQRKLAEGWTIAPGQNVGVDTEYGNVYLPSDQAQAVLGESSVIPSGLLSAGEKAEDYRSEQERQRFEDRGAEAALAGAARGLTFGASDAALTGTGLVDPETLAGLQEHNTGASLAGEFVPLVATTIATGGTGLAARALQKTPAGILAAKTAVAGAKSTKAFIAANAAEAAVYGVGQNVSQIAIHDEPLTAENMVWNSARNAGFGGFFGASGAALFKTGSKLISKGKAALAKGGHPMFDITTAEGGRFMKDTSRHLSDSIDMGDDLLAKTSPGANKVTADELADRKLWDSHSADVSDDLVARLEARQDKIVAEMEMPTAPKVVEPPAVAPAGALDADGLATKVKGDFLQPRSGGASKEAKAEMGKLARETATSPEITTLEAEMARAETRALRTKGRTRKEKEVLYRVMHAEDTAAGLPNMRHRSTIARELKQARINASGDTSLAAHMEPLDDIALPASKVKGSTELEYKNYQKELKVYEEQVSAISKIQAGAEAEIGAIKAALAPLKAGKALPDDVLAAKKFLKDSPSSMDSYRRKAQVQQDLAESVRMRVEAPVTPDRGLARGRYQNSLAVLEDALGGRPTAMRVNKALNGTPEEVMEFYTAANQHYENAIDLARMSGDKAALKQAEGAVASIEKHFDSALSPEMKEAAKHLTMDSMAALGLATDYMVEGGPLDGIAKVATVLALARGRGGQLIGKVAGKSKTQGLAGKLLASGGAGSARATVKGSGFARQGLRSFAGRAGYELTQGAMGKAFTHQALYQASGRANSAVTQAVKRMLGKTVKASMSGTGAIAALKALKFNDEAEADAKDAEATLAELFKSKSRQLIKYAADPESLAQAMYDEAAELRAVSPTLGDKYEVGKGAMAGLLLAALPKDPGTQHVMGVSTWQPSDLQIQKFANAVLGALFPMEVIDGITNGDVSIEAARMFEKAHPVNFARFQMEVAKNATAIAETLEWEEQNRLSVVMGVPVNSMNTPEYRKFIVEHHTKAQTAAQEASKNVDANALLQGTPTQAQQLQKRGQK